MSTVDDARDQLICSTPVGRPDPGLVVAACRAGALGVVDLGRDRAEAERALRAVAGLARNFGVRIGADMGLELPPSARTVIVAEPEHVARHAGRRVLAEVTSLDEARAAIAAGAAGLIAKGHEAGGRIGDETTFVLVQRLVEAVDVPVWALGGIGEHTAAACIAGGATGVVLDTQLALVHESALPAAIKAAIANMDGSETAVIDGARVFAREGAAKGLPIGQDGAIARPLARAYPSIGQLVRGLRAAIASHLELAAQHRPLAPGSPFAVAHGTRYPIAQGPMSRVSDRAGFAEAVARAGGLPFLALTLMSGADVRELLVETKARLGDLPWGVGILGFVPPEIREAQLTVLREIAPPVALIAGGRPSQAHPLETQGTQTYLHVPSPGLLDLFLTDGARRFVFEGSECGGHVGPRSSFALWEAQLARLLAFERPHELSVLFAGGIHDARSAAMVAAMAAPLAARGAKVGVLMGTAYLFTHEAVAAGAIQQGFQDAAIACDRTVLLETSPGHSTRCAATDYVETFAREKTRLAAGGLAAKEMWAELEQMNLGRLRIAAKGLRRESDALVEVDRAVQEREGMYMIGQVAALRRATISVAELHRQVAEDGTAHVVEAAVRTSASDDGARGTDIAIIGVAAMFPGAIDTETFWANIVAGRNAVREVPPERWDVATYYDPAAVGENAGRKTPCKWGGFLDDIPFDPLAYGIPPKSLAAIEPVQLLSLEIARRALADAGYTDRAFDRARCAVIFGAEAGTDLSSAYNFRAMFPQYVGPLPETLDQALPRLSEDSFPGVLANVIAGRIANRLDLGGVNYTVDAACAASLAAVDLAVKELVSGSSDMVLCGGADLHNSINDYLLFASVHALSPTGQCHTFDASADGIVLGEGVASVVLKRLADAERDGDRIYAVIKGVAGASDGKSLGLTAPRKDGQIRALDRAYDAAGVSAAQVGLVEAHGTGTVVGDRTELATLSEVYTRAGAAPGRCVLGSVKSQIGHTKCAAGMAGLIKAALAIHHGVLPPTSNIKQPSAAWDPTTSPFVFLDQARPWMSNERVAAVSAFGFGGTNFHAVLTSHETSAAARATAVWSAELVLLRGADREEALAFAARIERLLDGDVRLRDVARTAWERGSGPTQIAIVADSIDDLRGKLAAARAGRADGRGVFAASGESAGKVAFVFSGQGSQKVGMLSELFVTFPRLHRLLALGERWAPYVLPGQAFTREERARQAEALTDTRVAQPALGMVELALAELMRQLGVEPDMVAGHSYGELAALCVAGAIGEDELLPLSEGRGRDILDAAGADPGTMAAVAADAEAVASIIAGCEGVVIANHNSQKQCVLSGSTRGVEMALVLIKAAGLAAKPIPVACAFHSPIVADARHALAKRLAAIDVRAPRLTTYSNVTARPYPGDADGVRARLAEQVASPVRFADEIEAMYADGARVFVEVGPGQVLARLVDDILGDRPHVTSTCDGGIAGLMRALAALAVAGVGVDPSALYWERDAVVLDLDSPSAKRASWFVNGQSARPASEPRATTAIAKIAPVAIAPAPASERDGTVLEYLRNMRAMVTTQRDVMLAYLGAQPAPVVEAPIVTPAARVIDVAAAPAPAARAAIETIDPLKLVIAIVSERTGYPPETLGLDLDLEADLSIDSIKRIEIIGELAQRLGLRVDKDSADSDAMVEELATRKTLRALVEWLGERLAGSAAPPAAETPEPPAAPAAVTEPAPGVSRYQLARVAAPLPINGHSSFAGKRFAIFGGAGGDGLAARLEAEGASVTRLAAREPIAACDGYVDLGPCDEPHEMCAIFERLREAVLGGVQLVFVVTRAGGAGGPAGLVKTLAVEAPGTRVRIVEVPESADPGALVHGELHAFDSHVEISYTGGERTTFELAPAAPIEPGSPPFAEGSVVLVTGGARGITARVAIAFAQRFGCHVELVGRSPLPRGDDPGGDAKSLRAVLAKRGSPPAEIEAIVSRTLADREIRETLAALGDRGTYHAVDVRTPAFAELVDDIYARRGRIDAVIHGAGVREDKLIRHKTADSFARVFDTKVAGARTLAAKLRDDVKLVVWFSSIVGAIGNRGQADYAAAGDALDKLARQLQTRVRGRVLSIDWGPWAGTGMVSPELEREYARRGLALIDPALGVQALLAEVSSPGESQVILCASDPRALVRPQPQAAHD
jgi:acyl transferase domain-containing protein/NAD(P)H-dependent flavin oxidoreductase YrpB (nitropropane dioxygenase family)/NADP-dependent 3-hydroxy acid dehydrogenase YdfG